MNTQDIEIFMRGKDLSSESDEVFLKGAEGKLMRILGEAEENSQSKKTKNAVAEVRAYLDSDGTQKRKLLSYCVGFTDPTAPPAPRVEGTEMCRFTILKQDELYLLQRFVAAHRSDVTFGDVVYQIMKKHNMTPPQVYKSVFMRRQDFARVTAPDCKNVTRKMAWQIIIGLRCSMEEADRVLFSAGYIRRNTRHDLTMQYFIEHNEYDIEAIDAALAEQGLKTFTCE